MEARETFDALVDRLAGEALLRLVRGENWRRIMFSVCDQAVRWHAEKPTA